MEPVMPDVYSTITTVDPKTIEQLANVIELRAAEPRQAQMREQFVNGIPLANGAKVIEIGCGTGAVCRTIASRVEVAEVVGVDPSTGFLDKARKLAPDTAKLQFVEGDGRKVSYPDSSFDAAVFYTTLCHVPSPDLALAEAYRLVKPGGWLAALDGDYSTTSVATGSIDPLQSCAAAAMETLVNDPWLARRLTAMVYRAGFVEPRAVSYGYVSVDDPGYLLTIVDRGSDALVAKGQIGTDLAMALKAEARNRAKAGTFFGHISYFSLVTRKPE
jgi:ubiquinone/menaquinone biosynthesis C-methylase UbiE